MLIDESLLSASAVEVSLHSLDQLTRQLHVTLRALTIAISDDYWTAPQGRCADLSIRSHNGLKKTP
jgi:hypothetical protein